ncbi:MAG: PCMD domain-containing protein [Muribaculaceae bacterium]|nr:PCMD domain-containing protein [Muribaculaceae bacterium]
MKRINKFMTRSAVALAVAALLPSCAMEAPFADGGDGTLSISTEIKGDVVKKTRAIDSDEMAALRENFVIWICNSKGVVKRFKGVDNIPESFSLKVGSYVADAWAGDSVSASFDKKFYRAVQDFEISKGSNALSLVCRIANVLVSVDPASLNAGLQDMKITFFNSRGELLFTADNIGVDKGYFMMPNAAETEILYKIEGKAADGSAYVKEGAIANVQRAHEYCMTVTADERPITEGGALIRISIADIPVIEDDIEVFPAPAPRGVGFDIAGQVVSTDRSFTDTKVYLCGYYGLASVTMDFSGNFTGMTGGQNILSNSVMTELAAKGIRVERQESYDAAGVEGGQVKVDEVYVTFSKEFLDALPASSDEFVVSFEATDARSRVGRGSLRIANTLEAVEHPAPVGLAPAPDPETDPMAVLSHSAVLTGYVFDAEAAVNFGIRYREAGASEWIKAYPSSAAAAAARRNARAAATRADMAAFSVRIDGLKPATQYEYSVFCDDFESSDIQKFTTESIFSIVNASFEDWSTYSAKTMLGTKNVILPGSTGDKLTSFWGSGNEGAATANKVLTDKSTDMVHSGQYSARLASTSAMNLIAAGNIFVGHYVETDVTNGVLLLGRPYDGSHPSKLRVYANYRPGGNVSVKNADDRIEVVAGGTDHGQVYVALTDEPVEIRTNPSKQKLFEKDDVHVLAYGQVTWTDAFGPDGQLQLLEIPLEYNERARSKRPTHLVIVASASKFGDFFAGSASSVMYLDDFELVYE